MDMLLIVALGALLIFFMFNSRKKQKQRQEKLSSGLAPGAQVMTSFGVFGTVVDVDLENNKVSIESSPGTVLTVHRQAIGNVEAPVEEAESAEAEFPADTEVPDDISSLDGSLPAENARNTEDAEPDTDSADAADSAEPAAGSADPTESAGEAGSADAGATEADAQDDTESGEAESADAADEDREDGAAGTHRG